MTQPREDKFLNFVCFAGLLIGLFIVLWMAKQMYVNAPILARAEATRREAVQQGLREFITENNCKHTGYGPGRSYSKVYNCDDGVYILSYNKFERAE